MTTVDYQDLPAAGPDAGGTELLAGLRRWLARRRDRRRMRNSMLELSRLDDRLLRDMGISHGDIRDALRGRRSSLWLEPMRRSDRE